MVLVQKWQFFQFFFFLGNIGRENVFYHIVERKNAFLGYKNNKFKRWKNWRFSKGVNPCFSSKNGHFSIVFLGGNVYRESVFYHILERKKAFFGYNDKNFKQSKIDIFQKGLTRGFGPKMSIFPSVFLGNIGQESVFYHILERQSTFLGYYDKKFKKLKNWQFSKGLNPWCGPKMAIFPLVFWAK